jgi:membrane protease YdiL (CAAX protease family)
LVCNKTRGQRTDLGKTTVKRVKYLQKGTKVIVKRELQRGRGGWFWAFISYLCFALPHKENSQAKDNKYAVAYSFILKLIIAPNKRIIMAGILNFFRYYICR